MLKPYTVLCVQPKIQAIPDFDYRDPVNQENVQRQVGMLRAALPAYREVKLAVFPLVGSLAAGELSRRRMRRLGILIPGAETEFYGQTARQFGLYIASAAWERDEAFPDACFFTSFLISPEGRVILKKRSVLPPSGGNSNLEFQSQVMKRDGPTGVFPVAETPLGRIGLATGQELRQFEAQRALAMNGAEIIGMPMGDGPGEPAAPIASLQRACAFTNQVYVAAAAVGRHILPMVDLPKASGDWTEIDSWERSQIVDHFGRTQAVADRGGESVIAATVDIERLRYDRKTLFWLADLKSAAYAAEYKRFPGLPINTPAKDAHDAERLRQIAKDRLYEHGILKEGQAYRDRG